MDADSAVPWSFRSRDPVSNLRLKVTLAKEDHSALDDKLFAGATNGGAVDDTELLLQTLRLNSGAAGGKKRASLTVTEVFRWQQSKPLPSDEELFGKRLVLYTRTDADGVDRRELLRRVTTSTKERPSELVEQVLGPAVGGQPQPAGPQQQQPAAAAGGAQGEKQRDRSFQTFQILARVRSSDDGPWAEFNICFIKANANGHFEMRPGLSRRGTKPYRFEHDAQTYEYFLENLSELPKISYDPDDLAAAALAKAQQQRAQQQQPPAGDFVSIGRQLTFERPGVGVLRLEINGEIVSAHDFQCHNLFLTYYVDLPKGWRNVKEHPLTAITQMCQVSPAPPRDATSGGGRRCGSLGAPQTHTVAHYCFPLELEFEIDADDVADIAEWPRIIFTGSSYDYWDRKRSEGYGHTTLPARTGHYDVDVEMWKPEGTLRQRLHAYFVAGSAELQDVTYAARPLGHEGALLNRFGFRTIPAGVLRFRANVIAQKGGELVNVPPKPSPYDFFTTTLPKENMTERRATEFMNAVERARRTLARLKSRKRDESEGLHDSQGVVD